MGKELRKIVLITAIIFLGIWLAGEAAEYLVLLLINRDPLQIQPAEFTF